jgi:hypothetical protein
MKIGDLVRIIGYPGFFDDSRHIGLVTAIIPMKHGNHVQFLMLGKYHIMHESDLEVINESQNKKA